MTMSLAGDLKGSPFQKLTRLAVGLGLESDLGPITGNIRLGNRSPRPVRTIARVKLVPPHPARPAPNLSSWDRVISQKVSDVKSGMLPGMMCVNKKEQGREEMLVIFQASS